MRCAQLFALIVYLIKDCVRCKFAMWEQRPICFSGHDHIPDPSNCHTFFHCWGHFRVSLKHCGPFLMFNPITKVCDWPSIVIHVRPTCSPFHIAELLPKKVALKEVKTTTTVAPTTTSFIAKNDEKSANPKIIYIKPVDNQIEVKTAKRSSLLKNPPHKPQRKRAFLNSNGLFDISSLKVFTRSNVTSLSSDTP